MMKNYIAPEMEIVKFSAEDVITTSTVTNQIVDKGGAIAFADDTTGSYTYTELN